MKDIRYQVPSIFEGQFVTLNLNDIIKISQIIDAAIFTQYPGLNLIYDYFIEMTKILSLPSLPIL